METPERTRGRYALLAAVALTATSGCGNSVRDLFQPPSAMTMVSDAGRGDALNYRIGGPQTDQRGESGAIAAPRSDGNPNHTRHALTARMRDRTASGLFRPTQSRKKDTSP